MRPIALLLLGFAAHAAASQPPPRPSQRPPRPSVSPQPPPDTLDFSEVAPVLVGGIEALQAGIVYPDVERRAGIEGRVVVRFVVLKDGTTAAVEVVRSISPGLDAAAAEAVRAARFRPGMQNGAPVDVRQALPVSFRIADDGPDDDGPDGDALLAAVGEPWTDALAAGADSGAVANGAGRLLWHDANGDAVEAIVEADSLQALRLTFRPGGEKAEALHAFAADAGVAVQPDGFYLARDFAAAGFPMRSDLRADGGRLTMRRAACQDVPGYGCVRYFPTPVRGARELAARVVVPPGTQATGRYVVTLVVQADGSVADARLVPSGHLVRETVGEAVMDAVRATEFIPARRGDTRIAVPAVVTVVLD